MNEKPIIFSGPMASAIDDGRKTETRRIVKPQADSRLLIDPFNRPGTNLWFWNPTVFETPFRCPYGQAGGLLWVRETWAVGRGYDDVPPSHIPDKPNVLRRWYRGDPTHEQQSGRGRWRPSIHMPKWMARIWLEIGTVRMERLQEISAYDIQAEGIEIERCGCEVCSTMSSICPADQSAYREEWRFGWDSINGKRASWSKNPFVFVVSFHRVDRTQRCEQHGRHLVIERELDPYCVWCWNEQDPPDIGRVSE